MNLRSTRRISLLIVVLLATTIEGQKETKKNEHEVIHKVSTKILNKMAVGLGAANILYKKMAAVIAKNAVKSPPIDLPYTLSHELSLHGTHGGLGIPSDLGKYSVPSLPLIKGHESPPCIHAPSHVHHYLPSIPSHPESHETLTKYVLPKIESVKVEGLELVSLGKKTLNVLLKKLEAEEAKLPPPPKPEPISPYKPYEYALTPKHELPPPPKYAPAYQQPPIDPGYGHPKPYPPGPSYPYPQPKPSYPYPVYKPPAPQPLPPAPLPKPPCPELVPPFPPVKPPCPPVKPPCPPVKPPCLPVKPPCPEPVPPKKKKPAYPRYQDISSSNQTCGDVFLGYCTPTSRYRTIDGSCNNVRNPTWGMAGTRYGRLLPAIYSDGIHAPPRSRSNHELPSARTVSFTLFPDYPIPDPKWTLAAMQYGQIIAHDMALIAGLTTPRQGIDQCCVNGDVRRELLGDNQCMPIIVPENDPDYKQIRCLMFTRGATDLDSGCPSRRAPAEQLTTVTHYLDLSLVYGSNDQTARNLRSWWGGRLNVDVRDNREWLPRATNVTTSCSPDIGQEVCYAAGDERVNQNTQLTVLQIILLREHNRVAGQLSKINPRWSDETTYQETRRIVTAMHQWISYYEWLPIFIGKKNAYDSRIIYPTNGYVDDYDPSVNPSILNEHSTAAFRVFHSLIAGYIKLVSEQRRVNNALRLSDWFMRPGIIEVNGNMDDLTRGLASQPQLAQDEYYDKEITKFLFRGRGLLGGDLRAIDIQRNRDHGLASYNDFRVYCGLPRAHHWQQFEDVIDQQNIEKLSQLYESPDDVDLTVGGSLEFLVQGSLSGPTFQCILNEQFWRTRVGDRFWFESSNPTVAFTIEQLKEIKKSSLARWFCDNGDRVENMQPRAFELPSSENPITNCQNIPEVNLSFWKDYGPELDQHLQSSDYQRHENVYYKK